MQRLKSRHWQAFLCFALCFIVLWRLIEPHLIFYGLGTLVLNTSVFSPGWPFFRDALRMPGGLTHYASGFLSQCYATSWQGALVITLVGLALGELLRRHLACTNTQCPRLLYVLPAICLLAMYSRYTHPLAVSLALGVGLLFSLLVEKQPWLRTTRTRVIVTVFTIALSYGVAGFGGVLVFAIMSTLYLIGVHKTWRAALVTLPLGVLIIVCLTEYAYSLPPTQAVSLLSPCVDANGQVTSWISALYVLGPAALLLALLKQTCLPRHPRPKKKDKKARTGSSSPNKVLTYSQHVLGACLPFVLLALCLQQRFDPQQRLSLRIHHAALQHQWPRVLELARTLPKGVTNVQCNHLVNRALFHTGRLADAMFDYPQMPQALMLTHEQVATNITGLRLCDLFLELGHVNIAEKQASELLAVLGPLGPILKNLALINLVKDRPDTARLYLNVLKLTAGYRAYADTLLTGLDTGFSPDQAAYLDRLKANRRTEWSMESDTESITPMLVGLLTHNPSNQMAFEYLMAGYLLTGQVEEITAMKERIKQFPYRKTPAYYEEAMLIYLSTQKKQIDLDQYYIRRSTFQRYEQFVKLRGSMTPLNRQAVLSRLIAEFGNSYLFYYSFGRVGSV